MVGADQGLANDVTLGVRGGTAPFGLRLDKEPEAPKFEVAATVIAHVPAPVAPVDEARERADEHLSIENDIWQQVKDWWGPEASVNEIGLLEQQATVMRISPLALLRRTLRLMVQQGLWP